MCHAQPTQTDAARDFCKYLWWLQTTLFAWVVKLPRRFDHDGDVDGGTKGWVDDPPDRVTQSIKIVAFASRIWYLRCHDVRSRPFHEMPSGGHCHW
jgi:hypothetical protein